MLCKRGSWLLLLYFHVPNTSFNKSQHDFNSTIISLCHQISKSGQYLLAIFYWDFWEGDIFTLKNFSSFFCCFVLTIVQQSEYFFLSLSTNCLLHPIFFFGIFMKVYIGRQVKTQKTLFITLVLGEKNEC